MWNADLFCVSFEGHLDMVRFLLEAGADQEHKTDEMHTALMEACMVNTFVLLPPGEGGMQEVIKEWALGNELLGSCKWMCVVIVKNCFLYLPPASHSNCSQIKNTLIFGGARCWFKCSLGEV